MKILSRCPAHAPIINDLLTITPGGKSMQDDQFAGAIDLMERAPAMMDASGHGATASACRLQLAVDLAKIEARKSLKRYFIEPLPRFDLRLKA